MSLAHVSSVVGGWSSSSWWCFITVIEKKTNMLVDTDTHTHSGWGMGEILNEKIDN